MRRYFVYLGAVALGVLAGIVVTWATLGPLGLTGPVRNGPWVSDLTIGSAAAGPYTRARIALAGLLALAQSEAIYFLADADAEGRPLSGACDYTLSGRDPDARWWSVTVYAPDGFLIANAADRYSVSSATAPRLGDGRFEVRLNAEGAEGGLPTGSGPFTLALRLYNPGRSLRADPAAADMPRLTRGACR